MFRKYSSYILCLLIAILVVTIYTNDFSPLVKLEWKIQDLLYSFRGDPVLSPDIVMVNIDDRTLGKFGMWPWHRDRVADLVAAIGTSQPKTVLLDIFFDPNINEDTAGYTGILAGQMSWTKNVILPYEVSRAEFRVNKISNPKYLYNSSVQVHNDLGILDERSSLLVQKVFLPPERLSQFAAGLGFKYSVYDSDKKIRWEPLVMNYEGYYYPSASLLAAAHYLGIKAPSVEVYGGEYIQVGSEKIPTNSRGELFINFGKQGKSFPQVSAADILTEKIDPAALKGKLAIVSVTADMATDHFQTPVSPNLLSGEKTANVIENIVHGNFIKRIDSSSGTDLIILFVLGGIFAFVLPRVSLLYRLVILVICLIVLANLNFFLFNSFKILFRSLYVGLELILLVMASPILDNEFLGRFSRGNTAGSDKPEIPRLPKAKSFAKDTEIKVRHIMPREESIETACVSTDAKPKEDEEPSTDFEDSRQGTQERTTATVTPPPERSSELFRKVLNHSDQQPQDNNPGQAEEISAFGEEPIPAGISAVGTDSGQIKNLGRYRILAEIGKGAMGTVYKGVDPAINRNVALKTIRLDFVNDPEELAELKERLFREARAAGKLSHPNIVTIYDVGSEGSLHYIAMEYLQGQTLEDMIRRKVKFNYRIIAQIITQICSALDYAHNQGIVHRDIKPANIMVLSDYSIKVMDFGIARVDSSSMTRTGVAMGTPNYISPEQLQGKPVDRRTDLFSLGIMMYEMLLHRRPFRGENLTSLIYNIVNTEPEAPSSIDKSVPLLFDRVIARALKKSPDERYQKAGEISAALSDFIETFSGKRPLSV